MGQLEAESDRLNAFERWRSAAVAFLEVKDLDWRAGFEDFRRIAVNYVIARQMDGLEGAGTLVRNGLGHLAVGLVRPALDELIWLSWLSSLAREDAQQLLRVMMSSDQGRTIKAQRAFLGDDRMNELGFPLSKIDALAALGDRAHDELKKLSRRYKWVGSPLPNARWIAAQGGNLELYEYMHAATSRALHFSMGEVMRNAWGERSGSITTRSSAFRRFRAEFALFELPSLLLMTISAANELLEAAGIVELWNSAAFEELKAANEHLASFGPVPLALPGEWNL